MMILAVLLNICSLSSAIPEGENSSFKHLVRKRQIIGGSDATIEQYPYMVAAVEIDSEGSFLCGGAIVAPSIVITAAHCMTSTEVGASRHVKVGSSSHWSGAEHSVLNFIAHPDYDDDVDPPHDDLAIIQLEVPIQLDGVTTKAIGMIGYGESVPDGTPANVTGWGVLSDDGNLPVQLQSLKMKIVGKEECLRAYSRGSSRYLMDSRTASNWLFLKKNMASLVCATSLVDNELESTAGGDSGGPLVVGNRLVGINSVGRSKSKPPNVFTDVAYYRDWIDRIVSELTTSTR